MTRGGAGTPGPGPSPAPAAGQKIPKPETRGRVSLEDESDYGADDFEPLETSSPGGGEQPLPRPSSRAHQAADEGESWSPVQVEGEGGVPTQEQEEEEGGGEHDDGYEDEEFEAPEEEQSPSDSSPSAPGAPGVGAASEPSAQFGERSSPGELLLRGGMLSPPREEEEEDDYYDEDGFDEEDAEVLNIVARSPSPTGGEEDADHDEGYRGGAPHSHSPAPPARPESQARRHSPADYVEQSYEDDYEEEVEDPHDREPLRTIATVLKCGEESQKEIHYQSDLDGPLQNYEVRSSRPDRMQVLGFGPEVLEPGQTLAVQVLFSSVPNPSSVSYMLELWGPQPGELFGVIQVNVMYQPMPARGPTPSRDRDGVAGEKGANGDMRDALGDPDATLGEQAYESEYEEVLSDEEERREPPKRPNSSLNAQNAEYLLD